MRLAYLSGSSIGKGGIGNIALHGIEAAHGAGLLGMAIVLDGPRKRYYHRAVPFGKTMQRALGGLRMFVYGDFPQYEVQNEVFDFFASRYVRAAGCTSLFAWGGHSLRSIRDFSGTVFMSGASSHPLTQRRLILEEYRLAGIRPPSNDASSFLAQKTARELALADYIFPSSPFVLESMKANGIPEDALVPLPFGVDSTAFVPARNDDGIFRFIFSGLVGLRKGVHYLLEAWDSLALRDAELLICGGITPEFLPYTRRREGVRFLGFRRDMPSLYARSDAFVFPSIEEGSALVTYEAMASGLPLITTPNAGSVARNRTEGLIVPIRSVSRLREAMQYLYDNPNEARRMGKRARARAARFSWERHERDFVRHLRRRGE